MEAVSAAVPVALAMTFGTLAVYLPAHAAGPVPSYGEPVFDWLSSSWMACECKITMVCLVLGGVVLGLVFPRRWKLAGATTMLPFPIAAIAQVYLDRTSHNLFPIEVAIYGFFTLFSLGGAFMGQYLRRKAHA